MKPLFGFNKTTQQPGYAHQFITKSISKQLENEYDEIVQASYNIQRKMENKLRRYSKYILFFGIMLLLVCCIFWFIERDFMKMWETRSFVFILGCIGTAGGLIALIASFFIKPNKELLEDLEWNKKELEDWYKRHEEFFNFGDNTYKIDILCPQYKEKNGQIKIELAFGMYNNIPTIVYKEEDKLCISDNMSLYEIPYENVSSVMFLNEQRNFYNWTQTEKLTKEYEEKLNGQITKNGSGFKAKTCARIVFNFEGEEYYFDVLPYDFEKIEVLFSDKLVKEEVQEITE